MLKTGYVFTGQEDYYIRFNFLLISCHCLPFLGPITHREALEKLEAQIGRLFQPCCKLKFNKHIKHYIFVLTHSNTKAFTKKN